MSTSDPASWHRTAARDPRPEFMIKLGLAPPYAKEDVRQAYFEKAKQLHPDKGGTAAEFHELHEAFERAQAYLEFRVDRRAWIAAKMHRYIALEKAIDRLKAMGATVSTSAPNWLAQSFGDFAQLVETAFRIRALDVPNGDEIVAAMVDEYAALREVESVELTGANVSDDAVLSLGVFQQLTWLNLSRTPITRRALAIVDALPNLRTLTLDGTRIGWWLRRRTAWRLRRRAPW